MAGTSERPQVGVALVHGAELGSWIWDRLLPLLPFPTVAVDLPGRGDRARPGRDVTFDHAVDAVVADAEVLGTAGVTLVVHSFSGILAPAVVSRLAGRVTSVVFVGAHVPVAGHAWVDDLPWPQRTVLRVLSRVRPDGMRSPAKANATTLCHDLDDEATEAVLTRRVAEPPGPLLTPVDVAELPADLPRHYVRLGDDHAVAADEQQRSIERLVDVRVHDLSSGHLPMLGSPRELAGIIEVAATG